MSPSKLFTTALSSSHLRLENQSYPQLFAAQKKMLPADKPFFFWPGKLSISFLEPISPSNFSSNAEMKEHVFKLMWEEVLVRCKR
jgi:hypothetical protein